MNRISQVALLALGTLSVPLTAQTYLARGQVAMVGGTQNTLELFGTGGGSSTCYTAVNVGGEPTALLWDPIRANGDSFLVAGTSFPSAFLARVQVLSTGTSVTPILTVSSMNPLRNPGQLSFNQTQNQVVICDIGINQFYATDMTGNLRALTTGTQPWGNNLTAGALDPVSGDIYAGTTDAIYRISSPFGTPQVTPLVSGISRGVQQIAFDPFDSDQVVFLTGRSLQRVSKSTRVIQAFNTTGTNGTLTGLALDLGGSFKVANQSKAVFCVTNQIGGPNATQFGIGSCLNFGNTDIQVVGATFEPFRSSVSPIPGGGAVMTASNVPSVGPNPSRTLLFASGSTFLPVGTGPMFGLLPDVITIALIQAMGSPSGSILHDYSTNRTRSTTFLPPIFQSFAGMEWDLTVVAFDHQARYLGQTNVVRVTWQ